MPVNVNSSGSISMSVVETIKTGFCELDWLSTIQDNNFLGA